MEPSGPPSGKGTQCVAPPASDSPYASKICRPVSARYFSCTQAGSDAPPLEATPMLSRVARR